MSVSIAYPTPVNTARLKQFFWDVKDNRNTPRGIGGYYINDKPSTPYETGNTTATVVAQYTFTAGAGTNYIRVRVYGYVAGGTGYYAVVINGTTVAGPVSTTSTTNGLLIEYFGSLTPNTSYTVQITAYNSTSGVATYVSQVSINAGFGLTSTTAVNILTITLGTNDTYTLYANGNFVYDVGIRWWAKGNRKTTTTATIQSNLVSEIQGYYSPSAGDDGDNNVILVVRTGNYATSFTISGNVGASGDIIIITEIYAQICLRGNNTDSLGNNTGWELLIKEKGILTFISRLVTIDGSSQYLAYESISINGPRVIYISSSSPDVIVANLIFSTNDAPEYTLHAATQDDGFGQTIHIYINVIIIGA